MQTFGKIKPPFIKTSDITCESLFNNQRQDSFCPSFQRVPKIFQNKKRGSTGCVMTNEEITFQIHGQKKTIIDARRFS